MGHKAAECTRGINEVDTGGENKETMSVDVGGIWHVGQVTRDRSVTKVRNQFECLTCWDEDDEEDEDEEEEEICRFRDAVKIKQVPVL